MDSLYFWQEAPLLNLPAEVRAIIYHELALSVKRVDIKANDTTTDLRKAVVVKHPFSTVCRRLRAEAAPAIALYSLIESPKYVVSMTAFDFAKLSRLSDLIRDRVGNDIYKKKELFLKLRLGPRTETSLNNIYHETWRYINVVKSPAPSPFRFGTVLKLPQLQCNICDTAQPEQLGAAARTWRLIANEHAQCPDYQTNTTTVAASRIQAAFKKAHAGWLRVHRLRKDGVDEKSPRPEVVEIPDDDDEG